MAVSIAEYAKALKSLKEATVAHDQQADPTLKGMLRDAVIQRFEFTVELGWKTAVKALGLGSAAPKLAIREMAQSGLIDDVQAWFGFLEARNKSSHTYAESVALEVLGAVRTFLPFAEALLQSLKPL